ARYAWGIDLADEEQAIATFAEDAEFDHLWQGKVKGHAAIRENLRKLWYDRQHWWYGRQHLMNHFIMDPMPEGARVRCFFQIIQWNADYGTNFVFGIGTRDDRLVKRNGRWKFYRLHVNAWTQTDQVPWKGERTLPMRPHHVPPPSSTPPRAAAKFFRCDPEGPGAILESSVRVFVFALRNSRLSAGCKPSAEQFGGRGNGGDAAAAVLAVELDDEIDHRGGIFDRVGTRQAEAGLHDHQRELLERAARGVGVDRREAARVAGVGRAQDADAFGAAHFAEHGPVGAQARRRLQQLVGGDFGFAEFALDRDEADAVGAGEAELGRILDQDDALVRRDLAKHGVEERGLAGRGAARNEDRLAGRNRGTQKSDRLRDRVGERSFGAGAE